MTLNKWCAPPYQGGFTLSRQRNTLIDEESKKPQKKYPPGKNQKKQKKYPPEKSANSPDRTYYFKK